MASAYAIPNGNAHLHFHAHAQPHGHGHGHSHSHSYSDIASAPRSPDNHFLSTFSTSSGKTAKKALSTSNLYTHAEASRETSPMPSPSPYNQMGFSDAFGLNNQRTDRLGQRQGSNTSPWTENKTPAEMKGRPRGESDLGRPRSLTNRAFQATLDCMPIVSPAKISVLDVMSGLAILLPYLFASAAYSPHMESAFRLAAIAALPRRKSLSHIFVPPQFTRTVPHGMFEGPAGIVEAGTLTAGTLLSVAILAKLEDLTRQRDRRKDGGGISTQMKALFSLSSVQQIFLRTLGLALPFYATMELGGLRVGMTLLAAIASNLTCSDAPLPIWSPGKRGLISNNASTLVLFLLMCVPDVLGWTIMPAQNFALGYLALATSVFVIHPPLPTMLGPPGPKSFYKPSSPADTMSREQKDFFVVDSAVARSTYDINITLIAGVLTAVLTTYLSTVLAKAPPLSPSAVIFSVLAIAVMSCAILYSRPSSLRTGRRAGLAVGALLSTLCVPVFSPALLPGAAFNAAFSLLSIVTVWFDSRRRAVSIEGGPSIFTKFFLSHCEPSSLIHGVLSEKDSRRIAYFTILNFAFMFLQGVYGYLSGSLGLLSDTVHMFFDCLGLIIGLFAAVASKWPTSVDNPYGWGKLNTLAGFGNGVFLMLVSLEFAWEAMEGIVEQRELRHVRELMVVSVLGLLVNLVGLFVFGHAHAGHDHGHSHAGHSHGHSHGHTHSTHKRSPSHSHSHSHSHSQSRDHHAEEHQLLLSHTHSHDSHNDHGHGHSHSHEHHQSQSHSHNHSHNHAHHSHDHHNENMHGIFLHVAADAGGSLAVIISTALTLWKPWYLWDPLATILIAILIFAAAVPLVLSSARKLLLVVPDDLEYAIKNTLQELGELRGVAGYAVPRFWVDDRDIENEDESHHRHHHGHGHEDHAALVACERRVLGVIHVFAVHAAELEDVRERVGAFFRGRNMDVVVQVEREGEEGCWCSGGSASMSVVGPTAVGVGGGGSVPTGAGLKLS